jgi:hypothetical protein
MIDKAHLKKQSERLDVQYFSRTLRMPQVEVFENGFALLSVAALNGLPLLQCLLYHNRIHWFERISVQIMNRRLKFQDY